MPDIATDSRLSHDEVVSKIRILLEHNGSGLYGGEVVTQTEHALQCAGLAELAGANAKLITSSLLHDIGHLLEPDFGSATAQSKDFCHEALGDEFLKIWFDADVTEPVRLHVAAKRYLCATDPEYKRASLHLR